MQSDPNPKRLAVIQPNYIPWKGYFDLIHVVDELILCDCLQYTKQDWRNRNKIKTKDGVRWLTIPVRAINRNQKIRDTYVADADWKRKHFLTIYHNYRKAKFFKNYLNLLEELYFDCNTQNLSEINFRFIVAICRILGIETKISASLSYQTCDEKNRRLIEFCKQTCSTVYISGPSAKAYLNEELFFKESIALQYMDYSNYPEYEQLFPPFEHNVSIIDLLLNVGPECRKYMMTFAYND